MLAPADAALVERDGEIPGLGTLLDPDAFADALRCRFPDAPILGARARYARYKPGTSCLVAYVIDAGEAEFEVHAKAYGRSASDKLRKSGRRMLGAGPFGCGGVILHEIGAEVYFFPNDRELRSLGELADPEARQALMADIVPRRPELHRSRLEGLRYKPGRRYVARLVGDGGEVAVLRLYCEADYAAAVSGARAFSSGDTLRIAPLLGEDSGRRSMVLGWLEGLPLDDCLVDPGFDVEQMKDVAAALAEMHAQGAISLGPHDPRRRERLTVAAATALGKVCPDVAERALRLAQLLAGRLSRSEFVARRVHGDFSADQVLLTRYGVGIIDLDASTWDDPALDLGWFAAHLEREVARGNLGARRAEEISYALLSQYESTSGDELGDRYQLHFAAALIRLAYSPFRYREPEWPRLARTLVERAEEVARRG